MPYLPALDGLRAIALVGVICFHAGFTWMHGGYLPLTAFFVLSGFLITSLLLLERQRSGRINLAAFWGRRARRLVPAALIALVLIAVYTVAVRRPAPGLQGDVFSALAWVANWRFIFSHRSYADLFGDPSPLQHFWSLAVEEQFYLILPLVGFATLAFAKGKRWLFASVIAVLAVASTLTMRMLYVPGQAPLRAYFGTDTRAAELLVGVLLAFLLIGPRGLRRFRGPARHTINIAGALALAVTVYFWFAVREYDGRLYQGGLLGIALLAALVVTAGTQPGTMVSRVLSLWPLAALGRISYGVYLFHWPLFLWLNEERTGLAPAPLFALRMTITLALAIASYHLLEHPIRSNSQGPRLQLVSWANASIGVAALLVVVAASAPSVAVTLQTAAGPAPTVVRATTTSSSSTTVPPSTTEVPTTIAPAGGRNAGGASTGARTAATAPPTAPPPTDPPAPAPLRVMVVGDSLGVNLAAGLQRHLAAHGDIELLNYAFNGCSAVIDGVMRWPDQTLHTVDSNCATRRNEWAGQVRSFKPDVVLIHSSLFDVYDRKIPGWDDYRTPDDPVFQQWLSQRQHEIVSTLGAGGARVLWATIPCLKPSPYTDADHFDEAEGTHRLAVINSLIRTSGATIADLRSEICPGGQYSATVEGVGGARPDGVHLTDDAAAALADAWLVPLLMQYR